MVNETLAEPEWDAANERFVTPPRCPYPDCGGELTVRLSAGPAELAWCPRCQRPFEIARVLPAAGGAPLEVYRRPQSAFCTTTGQPLRGHSLLDWCEAGGGPGRSNSLDDARGAVFGAPDPAVRVRLAADRDWGDGGRATLLAQPDPDDRVVAVVVVRGQTVAATARGRLGIFDAASGEARLERPLDWPDASTDPLDPALAVRHSPAFRGTRMVLAAPHQAQFRDLAAWLLPGAAADPRFRLVESEPGSEFLGPPLGVDAGEVVLFCLLQGRPREGGIKRPVLRFFTAAGDEAARHEIEPASGIARPPVFDRRTGCVVWVGPRGIVSALAAGPIARGEGPAPAVCLPASLIAVEPSDRPTLVAARDTKARARTELWLSGVADGQTVLYRAVLDDLLAAPGETWYWDRRALGKLGPLHGFAVGIGSRDHRKNAAGQLLGVASGSQVALLRRYSSITATHPMSEGSLDPPIVCSAGVVARIPGRLCLDNQGVGWDDRELHPEAPVPGLYDEAGGLAMFGRRIYIGHGLAVRAYRLELGEGGDAT